MTPLNMARHRNSPHLAFWKVLKEGSDHFEATRKEPKVAVCDKHYVFDANSAGKFIAAERCPVYKVPQPIASAVQKKQQRDESETAQLISRGVLAAPATNGGDGGMNRLFLSALKSNGGPGTAIRTASGTIPARVRPPTDSFPQGTIASLFSIASPEPKPVPVRVASAAPSSSGISSFFGNLFGSKRDNTTAARESSTAQSVPAKSQAPSTKPSAAPPQNKAVAMTHTMGGESSPDAGGAHTANLLVGAAPTVPAGAFENRFGAWH